LQLFCIITIELTKSNGGIYDTVGKRDQDDWTNGRKTGMLRRKKVKANNDQKRERAVCPSNH
jgi:hypothetical protein